jgi:hypothetical protein
MTAQITTPKGGAYRRVVDIAIAPGLARVAMEDDIHHFRLALGHDGARIGSVDVASPRTPWTTCGGAAAALERLVGQPLTERLDFAGAAEKANHCTHLLDLANIALGRLNDVGFARRYAAEVEYQAGRRIVASMTWTGGGTAQWTVANGVIEDGAWAGTALNALPRLIAALPFSAQEPVLVLRRAISISGARWAALDQYGTAGELGVEPSCHTLLPAVRDHARRNKGSAIDFWGEGRWPLDPAASTPDRTEGQAQ